MKKLIMTTIAAIALAGCSGCKTAWTVEQVDTLAFAAGTATAKVANIYDDKIPSESRNATVEVMNKLQYSIPDTNETFQAKWTEIASRHLDSLIASKKITEVQKGKIMITVSMATSAIDRFCDKHDGVKQSKEYTSAIVHGFCTGFLDNFKPTNAFSASAKEVAYDEDTYNFLMQKYCK